MSTHPVSVDRLPLEGLRVVDFSRLMPGPWASQALGDMGADVVKIERKGEPDPSRFNAPHYREETVYFHSVNRNKRSIALDLGDPADATLTRFRDAHDFVGAQARAAACVSWATNARAAC